MLRFLAQKMCVGVGEYVSTVVQMNRAGLTTCVARQARVTGGVNVARSYVLAHFEARRSGNVAAGWTAAAKHGGNFVSDQRRSSFRGTRSWFGTIDFGLRHQSGLDQQLFQTLRPFLVVAHAQVIRGRDELDLVASRVDVPFSPSCRSEVERQRPSFPGRVEYGLIL